MSAPHNHHGHDDHHGHGHDGHGDGHHGSLKDYAIGFILSVILTAIPFWLVMTKQFDKSSTTAIVILAFAGLLVTAIGHTFNYKRDYYIPADVVERTETARTEELAAHV